MPENPSKGPSGGGDLLRSLADRTGLKTAAEEAGPEHYNYLKEAFGWQYNWIALAGAGLFALLSGSGLPVLLAAGLELMYLSIAPNSGRFRRMVRSWKYAEEKKQREMSLRAMYEELPEAIRARYIGLLKTCRTIRENYRHLSSTSQMFVEQLEAKLEGLSHSYLRLLNSAHHHREYLRNTDSAAIRRDIDELRESLEKESPKVQEINRKRIEILSKRLEKHDKIVENRNVVDAQCAAIEDVLELIRDQSVTMRDPQQLTDHLENLIRDVEHTEETIREVEAVFEMASPEMTDVLSPAASGESDAGPRARERLRY